MARSAMQSGRGWSRGRASRSGWGELAEPARKRLFEAGGFGLAPLALPLAMTAAALVAALLLSIMGLSWGDWRAIGGGAGRGASRLAHASGRGTAVAAELSGRAARYWREFRRDFDEGPPEPPDIPR